MQTYYKAINWNAIEDVIDKSTWEKLTEQFWLDTRIPLSNDLDDWRKLSHKEKDLVGKVFGGLTLLDTLQSESGVDALRKDVRTAHEEAVFNNIQFMESVHAKSYSSIFSTLNTKSEIDEIFAWTNTNPYLQKKADFVMELQNSEDVQQLFAKKPEEFKKGLEQYAAKYTDFLKKAKDLPKDFVKKEEKAINYEMLYAKSVYERAHKRYSGEEVKLPKEFADEVAKLDYDNAEDYNTFHTYKELVLNNLFDKYDDNAANPWGKLIDHVKGLKSASIKKDLARYFITGVSAGNADEINQQMVSFIKEYVKDTAAIKELDKRLKSIEKTKAGSNFAGFEAEDINGKAVNYESLKGKLVYVDVWATWCKPCLQELPAMKALQEEYKGKDITFVSLSVDKDKEAWKAMVTEEKMQGVQLHIDLSAHRDFIENYDLTGIPRFFLISKEGKIISISAPRPSEAKIKELINANL